MNPTLKIFLKCVVLIVVGVSIYVQGREVGFNDGRETFRTDMSDYLKKHYDKCWADAGKDQEKARDCLVQFQLGFAMMTDKELDGQ